MKQAANTGSNSASVWTASNPPLERRLSPPADGDVAVEADDLTEVAAGTKHRKVSDVQPEFPAARGIAESFEAHALAGQELATRVSPQQRGWVSITEGIDRRPDHLGRRQP